jgi:hypothetical protein
VSTSTTIPAWAAEWLSKREEQATRKSVAAKRAEEEPDEETLARRSAQKAKRSLDRETKVVNGLKELELWIRDLVRHGIASTQNRSLDYWEQMAARLIDAQAPGLARRVRDLTRLSHHGDGWTDQLLAHISSLFLLLKAYERLESLPATTQADVRTAIGWTYKEEELPEENLEHDNWIVLGQRITGEDSLRVKRTWLWGRRLAKGALILEFAVGGQYFSLDFVPGRTVEAELIFYPSSYPLRATLRKRINTSYALTTDCGYQTAGQLLTAYAEVLALNPWIESLPAPLQTVVPVRRGDKWFVRDSEGRLLSVIGGESYGWKLMALSGGHPITVFGEWNGRALLPLSTWADGRYRELQV